MLTSDLLRVRVRKAKVKPLYIDVEDDDHLERARALTEAFVDHLDQPKGRLDEALDGLVGHGTDWLLWRGLAKLLYDRAEFETVAAHDPIEVRRAVFTLSTALGPVTDEEARQRVLEAAAAQLELDADQVREALYADLDARQCMTSYRALDALALLHRYNLALAQAVLYRATRLDIVLGEQTPNMLRYLFGALKFHRLMHETKRISGGFHMVVDGPASLFSKSRKYGLQMATFLPALLLADDWTLSAELDWKGDGSTFHFELSDEDELHSHYRARGQWISDDEKLFERRFDSLRESPWHLERLGRIVELDGGDVLVTDYRLRHEDGFEAYVEIVGFWRAAYLQRRIDKLALLDEVPLVLVVSERLQVDREQLAETPAQVVFYKGVILVDKVLQAAESLRPVPEEP